MTYRSFKYRFDLETCCWVATATLKGTMSFTAWSESEVIAQIDLQMDAWLENNFPGDL